MSPSIGSRESRLRRRRRRTGIDKGGTAVCLATALLCACVETPSRPGIADPPDPNPGPELTGDYSADRLLAERGGVIDDLLEDPDTRLDLRLNSNGTAFGQLKIGAHPDLRTKQALAGTWRFSPPAQVTFELDPASLVEEIVFRAEPPRLTGAWMSPEGVRLHIELIRQD